MDFSDYIDQVKEANPIEQVVEEFGYTFERNTGITRRAANTGGLVVFLRSQTYWWETQSRKGDVIEFVMTEKGCDFKTAVEFLAGRAHLEKPHWGNVDEKRLKSNKEMRMVFSIAMDLFQKWLYEDAEALAYVHEKRGWFDNTILEVTTAADALKKGAKICDVILEAAKAKGKAERVVAHGAGIGFSGRHTPEQIKAMRDEFAMWEIDPECPLAVSILGFQGDVAKWLAKYGIAQNGLEDWIRKGRIHGMMNTPGIIYPHRVNGNGKLIYLTRRQLPGFDKIGDSPWKSHNPQSLFVGERKPFFNHCYRVDAKEVVVVEGQADAITFGQWGIAAVALCGTGLDALAKFLRDRHRTIYVALDNDESGQLKIYGKDNTFPVADLLGAMCRIDVSFGKSKDANAWLTDMIEEGIPHSRQIELVRQALNDASIVTLRIAQEAGVAEGDREIDLVKRAVKFIRQMDPEILKKRRVELARALYPDTQSPIREFNNLISDKKGKNDDEKPMEIVETFGCWIPDHENPQTGWLIDYIYDSNEGKAYLAYRNPSGEIGKAASLDIDGKHYIPKIDENIQIGIVMMPSDLGPLKTTPELLRIHESFHRRMILLDNPLHYKINAFYSLFTWVFDCFRELPYIRARGDKDTGKSAAMLRTGYICYRLAKSTGISTTASLKYATHTYHSTVFLDEMDVSDQFDERIVMLNIGAMKDQAFIWQMTPVKTADGVTVFEPLVSNVYGPKLITMYGNFTDPATESRCLTYNMYEKTIAELRKKGIPRRVTKAIELEALAIRNMSLTWRLTNFQPDIEIPEELEDENVSTRINQVTVPIKYLVKDDPKSLEDVTIVVRAIYEEQVMDKAASFEARILEAILAVLEDTRFATLGFVQEVNTAEYGYVKYIRYPDLGKVANFLMDEMNTGKTREVNILIDDKGEDEEEEGEDDKGEGKKKKKKKQRGITSKTIGEIVRKDLRLPVQRMGTGYVVILNSSTQPEAAQERLDVLKAKYGFTLIKKAVDAPAAVSTHSEPPPPEYTQEEMDYYSRMAEERGDDE